jgi:hypothetical protein
MPRLALLIIFAMSGIAHANSKCPEQQSIQSVTVVSASRAIETVKSAMLETYTVDYLLGFEPFIAKKVGNIWHVYGSLPSDTRGGTPEGEVCATNGEVLDIYHSQ